MNKNVKIALAVAMAALAVVLQGCGGASPGPTPTPGASQCPSSWTQDWRSGGPGHLTSCRWPHDKGQYANLSVASESDKGAACCAACAADSKCVQWTLQTEGEAR